MNKFKLMAVVAVLGALGLSAYAAPTVDADLITIKASISIQGETTESSKGLKFNVTTVKVVTKDVLGLVDDEFGTTYANTNGTQLAVDSLSDGELEVLDKNGNVLLEDVNEGDDIDYSLELGYDSDNTIATGSETETKSTASWMAPTEFSYNSGDDESSFDVEAIASVDQTFDETKEISSESFSFSGAGEAEINGSFGVITGVSVKGSSKNNDNVEPLVEDLFE